MSLLREASVGAFTEEDFYTAPLPTGLGAYLGENVQVGFDQSLAGRAAETLAESGQQVADMTVADEYGVVHGTTALRQATPLDEDRWRRSRFYREGIEYQPGFTEELAASRAQAFDERRWRDRLLERYEGGLGGQALGFIAGMAGGAVSPENYVPILGPAAKAAMVARLGRVGGAVATSAAEGAIGAAAASPLVYADLARRGEDVGVADVAIDVVMGAAVGSLFGGVTGALDARRAARVQAALDKSRVEDIGRRLDAVNLAAAQMDAGEPVNVGKVLSAEERFRSRMMAGAAEVRPFEFGPARVLDEDLGDARVSTVTTRAVDERDASLLTFLRTKGGLLDEGGELTARDLRTGKGGLYRADGMTLDDATLAAWEAGYIGREGERPSDDELLRAIDDEVRNGPRGRIGEDATSQRDQRALEMETRALDRDLIAAAEPHGGISANELALARRLVQERELDHEDALIEAMTSAALRDDGIPVRHGDDDDFDIPFDEAPGRADPRGADPRAEAGGRGQGPLLGRAQAGTADVRGDIGRFITDWLATERVDPPHPSIAAAAPRVGKGGDALAEMRTDMGLDEDDAFTAAELDTLRRDGRLTAAMEAELAEADELAATAERWAAATETLATCFTRYA